MPDLFDFSGAPAASRCDPVTSAEAAVEHEASGRRQRHAAIVLALIQAHPGLTGHELWAEATGAERAALGTVHEVYRRVSDLERMGKTKQGPPRVCGIKGRRMVTRWPT